LPGNRSKPNGAVGNTSNEYALVAGDLKNGFTFLALTDDVKHPDLYGTNSVSPRSAAISVCDDGYQVGQRELSKTTNCLSSIPLETRLMFRLR